MKSVYAYFAVCESANDNRTTGYPREVIKRANEDRPGTLADLSDAIVRIVYSGFRGRGGQKAREGREDFTSNVSTLLYVMLNRPLELIGIRPK